MTSSAPQRDEGMMNAYIAFRATVQVTHVRDVLLELALYLLHRMPQYLSESPGLRWEYSTWFSAKIASIE